MSGMTERIYPKDTNKESPIQMLMTGILTHRYEVACDWLRHRFNNKPLRILDIACGVGYGTEMLSELGEAVGVDIDQETIDYAKQHYSNDRVSFHVGDADDYSYLTSLGDFDAVVSSGTIEHVSDEFVFLKWIRQCLRKEGVCILCCPSTFTRDWAFPFHKRDISPKQARDLIDACDFSIKNEYFRRFRFRLKDLVYEKDSNRALPVPPLKHWFGYYLSHPHHFGRRLAQMSLGGGVLFTDQQYLLA